MEVSFYWGFLAEDKSAAGTAWYIFSVSGIYFAGLLVLLFFLKRKKGWFYPAFSAGCFCLFCFSYAGYQCEP